MQRTDKQDIYTRITNPIVSHLEKGTALGSMTCR
jgi:antirestriction protein ArdC